MPNNIPSITQMMDCTDLESCKIRSDLKLPSLELEDIVRQSESPEVLREFFAFSWAVTWSVLEPDRAM